MIDPVTAIATANAAFKGIQMMVAKGREIEDCVGQLSKWAGRRIRHRVSGEKGEKPAVV